MVRDLCGDGKCRRFVTAPRAAETQEGEVCNKRRRNEGLQPGIIGSVNLCLCRVSL